MKEGTMLNSVYKISEPLIKHVAKNDKMYVWLSGYFVGATVYGVATRVSAMRSFGRMRAGQMVKVNLGKSEYSVIKRTDK